MRNSDSCIYDYAWTGLFNPMRYTGIIVYMIVKIYFKFCYRISLFLMSLYVFNCRHMFRPIETPHYSQKLI